MARSPRFLVPLLLAVAAIAAALLLQDGRWLGLDTGAAGTALLVLAAWGALFALGRADLSAFENAVSPGEWRAWIGTAFTAVAVAYFVSKLHVFQSADLLRDPAVRAVTGRLVTLLVAWTVLSSVLDARWKHRVQRDERDAEIERHAAAWGRGATVAGIVVLAVLLGFSPPERLEWATPPLIANQLVLLVMVGSLFEYAASALRYMADRR
ncbi:MAG TPA: hypothetical protein VIG54_09020 [Lysobacter sp.]